MAKKEVKQYLNDVLINKIDYYVSIKKFDFDTIKEMLAIDLLDYEPYMIQTIDKYIKYIIWLDQKNKNKSEAFLKFLEKYQTEEDQINIENKESSLKNTGNLDDYHQRKKHQNWLDEYFKKQKAKYHVYEESPLDNQTKVNNFEQYLEEQNDEDQVDQILDKDLNLVNLIASDDTFYQTSTINLDDLKTTTNDSFKDDVDEEALLANQQIEELEIDLDPEEFGTATINVDRWQNEENGSKSEQEQKVEEVKEDKVVEEVEQPEETNLENQDEQLVEPSLDEQDLTKDTWFEEKDLTDELIEKVDLTKDSWTEIDGQEKIDSLDQKLISEPVVELPEKMNTDEVEELSKEHWVEEKAELEETNNQEQSKCEDTCNKEECKQDCEVKEDCCEQQECCKESDCCKEEDNCDKSTCKEQDCKDDKCCEVKQECCKKESCCEVKQECCEDNKCCEEQDCCSTQTTCQETQDSECKQSCEQSSSENKQECCKESDCCKKEDVCDKSTCNEQDCKDDKCCEVESDWQENCGRKDGCECSVTNCPCDQSCDIKQQEISEQQTEQTNQQQSTIVENQSNQLWINKPETNLEQTNNQVVNNKIWTISPDSNLVEYTNDKDFLDSRLNQVNETKVSEESNTEIDTKETQPTLVSTDDSTQQELVEESTNNTTEQPTLTPNQIRETPKFIELSKPVKLYQQVKWNDKTYYVVGIKLKKDVFGHEVPVLRLECSSKPYEIIEVKFVKKY
ncbi:hypothetical protein MFERI14815_00389 [Mycoplasma feriruminatoris]|uniref:hypothetical protein n=1 Tax=Mycoplasma feriruminatoris TaxID=1179777 RepID=UPI00241D2414|nr:hypothetical protein [Mycoplasma feriruminatoris]WFQ91777.1 hypothetical protein MFERI14815_00389 [Mycoplasma feriruminatoris]